jgi:thymidylate synthase ThyX
MLINQWNVLKEARGYIDPSYGGRYVRFQNGDSAYISDICLKVCLASVNKEEREVIPKVIKELKRLYKETDLALKNEPSRFIYVATCVYDLREKIQDGFTPIARLEEYVEDIGKPAALVFAELPEDLYEKGVREGKKAASLEIARKLVDKGFYFSEIEVMTGLSSEEIKKLI